MVEKVKIDRLSTPNELEEFDVHRYSCSLPRNKEQEYCDKCEFPLLNDHCIECSGYSEEEKKKKCFNCEWCLITRKNLKAYKKQFQCKVMCDYEFWQCQVCKSCIVIERMEKGIIKDMLLEKAFYGHNKYICDMVTVGRLEFEWA